jgi:hypothetical protein
MKKLELKQVKFIEGTLEFEPGFEASLTAFAEAIALVEGTYLMHVSAEAPREKGAAPDTALSRKRVAKVWGLMAANGVLTRSVCGERLPARSARPETPEGGDVKIEIIARAAAVACEFSAGRRRQGSRRRLRWDGRRARKIIWRADIRSSRYGSPGWMPTLARVVVFSKR